MRLQPYWEIRRGREEKKEVVKTDINKTDLFELMKDAKPQKQTLEVI